MPLAARCDMYWPADAGSDSNHQYILLDHALVAPIFNSTLNLSSVPVWLPPGEWIDVWSGARLTGPANMTATQPYERIPMWHRAGSMIVTAFEAGLRVEAQDWSKLVIHAYIPRSNHSVGTCPVHAERLGRVFLGESVGGSEPLRRSGTTREHRGVEIWWQSL